MRSTASFRQNHFQEASRKGGCSDRGGRRRRTENPSWYGRESGWQGDSGSRHKDTKTDGKTWGVQGRCLRRATENEGKKRRWWRVEQRGLRQGICGQGKRCAHPESSYDPRDQGSRTSKAPGRQKGKLAEDLPRPARGQSLGVEDGSTRGRKEPLLTWREKCFATEEVATLGMDARKTKVAAEKAFNAALELCKEKQSTPTGSKNSTELKKRSTCRCRS